MTKPSTPAAAAAEIRRQQQIVAEVARQNSLRRQQQAQSAAPITQQKQKQNEIETRKQLRRDRAVVQAQAKVVNSPQTSEADRTKAVATLTKTVLKGTRLQADDAASSQMLGKLTADLCANPGTVIGLGVKDAIKLKVSPADAASIPEKVVQRLKRLV